MAMGGLGNNSDDRGPVAEINVTPLVDVMLVLLVIFMVTAPFMENGIPIQLPKAAAKALQKENEPPITLNLTKETKLYINREEVFLSNVQQKLQAVFKNRARKEVFIRADGTLPYAFVAQAMALVKAAGIDKIGLVTLPPEAAPGTGPNGK